MFEILWILFTLIVVSTISVLAKKWGPDVIISLVVGVIIIANILASKIIIMFGFTVPAGVIVYSISFLLTDTLSEFFGKNIAKRAVWLGFFGNLIFLSSTYIALNWQNAFGEEADLAFQKTLSLSARVTFAALVTYLISQFHDVWAYDFWGKITKGKHLWIRNNASTIISQTLDTFIFITIAFWGILPIFPLILGQLVVKIIIAIIDTFFLYGLKKFVFNSEKYKQFEAK